MKVDLRSLSSPDYRSKLNQCIHCGMCLQVCPTYVALGTETDSPRGRIALMRAASDGRIPPGDFHGALARHLDLCLTCRACETACPSGVQYGAIVETMRQVLDSSRRQSVAERLVRWVALRQTLPHIGRLKVIARLLRVYQAIGLERVARAIPLPRPIRAMANLLPPIVPTYQNYRAPNPPPATTAPRGRVAFFYGCIQEAFLASANAATVRVLRRNGYEVCVPAGQTCCGAAHLHTGERDLARELARRNIDALLAEDYDAVIDNAGGCGAMLKQEYPTLMQDDPIYAARARQLAAKVHDLSEFLAERLVPPTGLVHARAVYSDSCHLRHVQHVASQPRELLKRIPGLELVELQFPDRCCGSAGIYNIVHPDTAAAVLDLKMADIASTRADMIVTSNTGCHMQLLAGVRKAGLAVRVLHIAELLDLSYRLGDHEP